MGDLYFNELSVDFSFSKPPINELEGKKLLLGFIQTYSAYRISSGIDLVYVQSKDSNHIKNIIDCFREGKFFIALDELEIENKITYEEKYLFLVAIREVFSLELNPEFFYQKKEVFGFGAAIHNNCFAISYCTEYNSNKWNHFLFEVQEYLLDNEGNPINNNREVKNISSINHVVEKHEIWNKCTFNNTRTSKELLPNKSNTEFVVKSITGKNWVDYYASQQQVDITVKKKIGRAVARINGWIECATTDHRLTFKAGNRYLAIDTENSTFEVYKGINDHKGEMKFYDETINTAKADPMRRVTLR